MRTRHWEKLIGLIGLFIVFFALTALCASAETEGIFTYTVANDEATVTKVDCSEVKDVVIPETLGGASVLFSPPPDFLLIAETIAEVLRNRNLRDQIVARQNKRLGAFRSRDLSADMRSLFAPLLASS